MVNILLFNLHHMLAVAPYQRLPSFGRMATDDFSRTPLKAPSAEAQAMGRALKALRERQRLTQQAAADGMGITKTAWQNYENGRAVILRTDVQTRAARALGCDRRELLLQLAAQTPIDERPSFSGLGVAEGGGSSDDPFRQRAIFPLREGDVTLTLPPNLSADSFEQLEQYLLTFLKARRPSDA